MTLMPLTKYSAQMRSFLITGKLDAELKELPIPEPGPQEVRIKVAFVGVCGSDLHYYFDGANGAFVVQEPLTPGHELSGTIDFDSSGELAAGTAVTVHPATFGKSSPEIENDPHIWPDGKYLGSASTMPHTQGAMSDYFIVRRDMVRILPMGLSLKDAALAEPLAVALHAINIAEGVADKKVLVSGSGPIGLLVAAAARIKGASEVVCTDVLTGPLECALAIGATRTIQISKEDLPDSYFDCVFECSGSPIALSSALNAIRRAGTVIQVGMLGAGPQPIAIAPLVSKEIRLKGAFRFNNEITEAVELLATHSVIATVITHILPASDVKKAFDIAKDSQVSGKVLVDFQ
jgi:L-idonate 5-dehydrogenase